MERRPLLSRATGLGIMTTAVGAYFAMLQIFAESGRPRMWPTWWLLVPVALFTMAALLMLLPLRRRSSPPPPQQPRGSFEIGGPDVKVGRASITDSYSNHPEGFGGIYGDEIEDAKMEGNTHDVPGRQTEEESEEDP